jgi:hypothetical protein
VKAAQRAVELREEMVGASVLDRKARREAGQLRCMLFSYVYV